MEESKYCWIMLNETFDSPLIIDHNFITALADTADEALTIMLRQHDSYLDKIMTSNYDRRVVKFDIAIPVPTILTNDGDYGNMYMDRKSDTKPNRTIQDPDYFLDVPDDENQDIN